MESTRLVVANRGGIPGRRDGKGRRFRGRLQVHLHAGDGESSRSGSPGGDPARRTRGQPGGGAARGIDLADIARRLGTTTAQIAGVLSYYPDLRVTAPGRHVIRVCVGESCYANGCSRVLRELQDRLRTDVGETTSGGKFTLDTMSCAGNCAVSPTVVIDRDLYGRVLPSQVETMLERYR